MDRGTLKETKSDSKLQILFSSHELLNKAEQEAALEEARQAEE